MGVLSKGTDFTNGDQVTDTSLDNLVDNATFTTSAVDEVSTDIGGTGAIIVKDEGITTGKLANSTGAGDGVTTAKLATAAVTAAKLGTDAVTTVKILDANVTTAKIADAGNVSGGAAAPAEVTILDEDTLVTDSATALATQQSIKAYVDTEVAGAVTTYKSSFVACPASSANTVFAHSLGAVPDIVNVQLKCISASNGFATGEIVMLSNSFAYASYGSGVEIDATNVTFHSGPNGLILIAPDGTYKTIAGNYANFEIKVIAAIL
jgi:hypothetical protein